MARKIVNRKALREEVEAAERSGSASEPAAEKKVAKKKTAKRKSRSAEAKVVRVKLFWLVVNQSGKQVGQRYEYHQKEAADKKAEELSQGGKSPHWVQKHREPISEE
jgi:hypothetical protein